MRKNPPLALTALTIHVAPPLPPRRRGMARILIAGIGMVVLLALWSSR